jgi:hypothetical protein
MSALLKTIVIALCMSSWRPVEQAGVAPPSVAVAIGPQEIAAAIGAESAVRVRIARGDSAFNVIVVKRAGGARHEAQYDCGPAWVVWPAGEAPEIDAQLLALPFSRLVLVARPPSAESAAEPSGNARDNYSDTVQIRPRITSAGDEAFFESFREARCGPVSTPIEPEYRSEEIVVWWPLSKVASVHGRAVEGLDLARSIVALRQSPEFLAADLDSRDRLLAPLQESATRWIEERLDAPPPIGNASIAWIELMDARQALLRVENRVGSADAVVRDLRSWLSRSRLPHLRERLDERVPVSAEGFVSLCAQPCWIFDAGEVAAASQRLMVDQRAVCDAIEGELSRLQPCSQEFATEFRDRIRMLVGQLPNGARVTDRTRELMKSRLGEYCALGALAADRTLIRDFAATMVLEIWTEAWVASAERTGDAEAARMRWRTQLTELATRVVQESSTYSQVIKPGIRRAVSDGVARMIDRQFDGGSNYLTAFAGDRFTLERVKAEWLTIIGGRDPAALAQTLATIAYEPPAGSSPQELARAEHIAREAEVRIASQEVFADLMQAMYMALTESDSPKTYPEPFPLRYASFRASGERIHWRIGLD